MFHHVRLRRCLSILFAISHLVPVREKPCLRTAHQRGFLHVEPQLHKRQTDAVPSYRWFLSHIHIVLLYPVTNGINRPFLFCQLPASVFCLFCLFVVNARCYQVYIRSAGPGSRTPHKPQKDGPAHPQRLVQTSPSMISLNDISELQKVTGLLILWRECFLRRARRGDRLGCPARQRRDRRSDKLQYGKDASTASGQGVEG